MRCLKRPELLLIFTDSPLENLEQILRMSRGNTDNCFPSGLINPRDLMEAFGVSPESLAGPEPAPQLIALWEKIAREAETRYNGIRRRLEAFDKEARLPILLSLLYYSRILKRCRRAKYHFLDRRIFVPRRQKIMLFGLARWQLFRRSLHR